MNVHLNVSALVYTASFWKNTEPGNAGCGRAGLCDRQGEAFTVYSLCLLNSLTCGCISYLKYSNENAGYTENVQLRCRGSSQEI